MSANTDQIHLIIIDSHVVRLQQVKHLLEPAEDIHITATAASPEGALHTAQIAEPDVILMDLDGLDMDGIMASETLMTGLPDVQLIMVLPKGQADTNYLRRAVLAGVREFVIKPFSQKELTSSIRRVYQQGKKNTKQDADRGDAMLVREPVQTIPMTVADTVIERPVIMAPVAPPPREQPPQPQKQGEILVVFSANGGIGRSTIAANLAIALQNVAQGRVALVDCSLRFGDIGALLNIRTQRSIVDVCSAEQGVDTTLLSDVMVLHSSGVQVLLAPTSPELGDLVTPSAVSQVLATLRAQFDYIVVDTYPFLDETVLTILDLADRVLLLTTSEIPAIKNTKLFFHVAELLTYPTEKIVLILNQHNPKGRISPAEIEASIKHPVFVVIEKDDQVTTQAVQTGQPFVVNQKMAPISQAVYRLANKLVLPVGHPMPQPPKQKRGFFR